MCIAYFTNVGNTQNYALGEWDFAKYPDGKQVNEPVVQTGARYESPKELFLKKANKAYKDLEDNGLKGFAKRANDVVQDVASNIVSLEDAEKRLNGIIYESENPLVSGEWRDLGDRKVYFWEDMRYGEIVDTRKTEGRSKNVSNPWRTGDGKLFESLSVAKQHELETTSKYMFINDGYMQKTKSSETQQPASEPPTVANGKIYDYLKEMGKPDSKVEFDDDYMVLVAIATRDINNPMEDFIDDEYDLEKISKRLTPHKEPLFREAMVNFKKKVIAEQVAAENPDRDYLQSIIDGKADLEAKGITAKIREIVLRAKNASDTEMLALANTAAKTYATYAKTKSAAKLAEVQ